MGPDFEVSAAQAAPVALKWSGDENQRKRFYSYCNFLFLIKQSIERLINIKRGPKGWKRKRRGFTVCPLVREIIHSLKLVDYILVQSDKSCYNYNINEGSQERLTKTLEDEQAVQIADGHQVVPDINKLPREISQDGPFRDNWTDRSRSRKAQPSQDTERKSANNKMKKYSFDNGFLSLQSPPVQNGNLHKLAFIFQN